MMGSFAEKSEACPWLASCNDSVETYAPVS